MDLVVFPLTLGLLRGVILLLNIREFSKVFLLLLINSIPFGSQHPPLHFVNDFILIKTCFMSLGMN